jgi:hypothetical protein
MKDPRAVNRDAQLGRAVIDSHGMVPYIEIGGVRIYARIENGDLAVIIEMEHADRDAFSGAITFRHG